MSANRKTNQQRRHHHQTKPQQPFRQYSLEEDVRIIQLIAEGRGINFICQRTNRTRGGILNRVTLYIENHKTHCRMQELSIPAGRILGMRFEYVALNIERIKAFKNGRGKVSMKINQDLPA